MKSVKWLFQSKTKSKIYMRKNRTASQTLSLPLRFIYMRFSGFIWVGLALLFLGISIINPDRIAPIRASIMDVLSPPLTAISAPFSALSEKVSSMTEIGVLRAENIKLSEENSKLREWYQTALTLQAENQSLREFLNVKAEAEHAYLTTRVISDGGGRFAQSYMIPVGQAAGVAKGQAVINGSGMVGRVVNAGQSSAQVLLITDLNSRIPVMIEKTHHRAILAGQNTKSLKLSHLTKDSGVTVGARIVTSGHDGVLPPNIPVGVVTEVVGQDVLVSPLANIKNAHFVQVIAGAQRDQNGLFLENAP